MSKFWTTLFVFAILWGSSSQALALKANGHMGATIVQNILSFSPEDADAFCLDNPEFHNCDLVRQRQEEERKIIELNSNNIDDLEDSFLNGDFKEVNFTTTILPQINDGNDNLSDDRFLRTINFE